MEGVALSQPFRRDLVSNRSEHLAAWRKELRRLEQMEREMTQEHDRLE